ncbi:TIGR03943 family protein [Streptacidiphilus pinicola]|uniref:TIGR03943 family protein n=2 Tax=Streptacidiphilus pinicola TaxID=2219663 RepID=A0A2X0K9C4_9ACTN|nr:TIGR03943 family protein [Streptacidiphilus pinicola]
MLREARAILLVLTGAALLHLSLFGDGYLRYVRRSMHPWLITAGVVLLALGLVRAFLLARTLLSPAPAAAVPHQDGAAEGSGSDGHAHRHLRAAWLLLCPLAAVFLAAPPALGDYTAQHTAATVAKPASAGFPALAAGDPLTLPIADFVVRAVWDPQGSLRGRHVRLTGFAMPKPGGGWYLTRLTITCCAADAVTYRVDVRGLATVPSRGTWVEVTGTWQPDGRTGHDDDIPVLTATSLIGVPTPADPYE